MAGIEHRSSSLAARALCAVDSSTKDRFLHLECEEDASGNTVLKIAVSGTVDIRPLTAADIVTVQEIVDPLPIGGNTIGGVGIVSAVPLDVQPAVQTESDFFVCRLSDGTSFLATTAGLALKVDPTNETSTKIEGANLNAVGVQDDSSGTGFNIRDLIPTRDEVKVEGDNADPVVTKQVLNVRGDNSTFRGTVNTTGTFQIITPVASTERVVVGSVSAQTTSADTIGEIIVFEEDDSSNPIARFVLPAGGGGASHNYPFGKTLTQAKELRLLAVGSNITDAVVVTANYKLETGLSPQFTAGDKYLIEGTTDAYLIEETSDAFLIET